MADNSNGAGHFMCPCATCIITEALKYEQRKQYKEADSIMDNGLQYYLRMYKQVDSELVKFRSRTKYNTNTSVPVNVTSLNNESQVMPHFTQCQHFSHRPNVKTKEFSCPVAIFNQIPDPTQRPMYPKNLVYFDENDHQLEEIWAARYWAKNQSSNERIPDNLRKIISSEHFNLFIGFQGAHAAQASKNPTDITNVGKQDGVVKKNFVCDPTEVENINPLASEIMKDTANPISEVIVDQSSRNTPQSRKPESKNSYSGSRTSLILEKLENTSAHQLKDVGTSIKSNSEKASLELPEITSSKVSISMDPAIKNQSSTINSPDCEVVEVSNGLKEVENEESKPFVSGICKDAREHSRIPTFKKSTSTVRQPRTEVLHHRVTTQPPCSETFVLNRNPSETYVIKADDTPTALIDNEILTLVHDEEDDSRPCSPDERISQLFKPSEMNTSTTEAFSVALPSSTPNKRMSQFFRPAELNTNCGDACSAAASVAVANLSTITEISREHYSSSSRPSQKTPLQTINEAEKSDDSSKDNGFDILPDPFDADLIKNLLQKIQFPRIEHKSGYNKINCDMAQMKLSSVVKLGNNKYSIVNEIGKGNYARILKLQDVKDPSKMMALKQQKPACPWEFYISQEIQRRLCSKKEKSYFIHYSEIYVYRNGSVMVSDWAPYGSILNFVNDLKISPYHNNRCPIGVAVWLSIQFVEAIHYLHSCKIIHGDVKPDNFVLYDAITTDRSCVKLIDFGRSIDMTLFSENTAFTKVVTTEDYTCNEMKDNRPWTYQTDYFGLASTIYLLLVGEYMKTKKELDEKWTLAKNLPRYVNRDLWNPIFENILNIPSCNDLPDLMAIKQTLKTDFNSIDKKTIALQFTNVGRLFEK